MTIACAESIDKINQLIAHKLGQQRYKIWFKNSTRLIIEDDYIKVGVPNLFIGGWIENHFADQIADAVHEVTKRHMKVIFAIDPELLGSRQEFAENVSKLVEKVKSTKKVGDADILAPGARGSAVAKANMESGQIEVEDNLLDALRQIAN